MRIAAAGEVCGHDHRPADDPVLKEFVEEIAVDD
jgi:hypothetical protein